ncbi:hypothetical protein WMY93_003852 [Mugilogobius chulae]|uniref:Uncharacterized protein n=1 Tax=Mugilogobius chulae TaxID=88201 RepID=A0AAW0PXV3_9GOBI
MSEEGERNWKPWQHSACLSLIPWPWRILDKYLRRPAYPHLHKSKRGRKSIFPRSVHNMSGLVSALNVCSSSQGRALGLCSGPTDMQHHLLQDLACHPKHLRWVTLRLNRVPPLFTPEPPDVPHPSEKNTGASAVVSFSH